MAPRPRRPARALEGLVTTLGMPGLVIAALSLLSLAFGLIVLTRESDRPRRTLRDAVQPVIASWVRSVPVRYVGLTLVDFADRWRRAPEAERAARHAELRAALDELGNQLAQYGDRRSPLIEVVAMDLRAGAGPSLAGWVERDPQLPGPSSAVDAVEVLPADGPRPALTLGVRYRVAPDMERAADDLGDAYFRLVLAVLGLSLFPLLCLIYMVLQAGILRDRAAREAAQEATLDLANRTCHELGNVAFVLQNERRNLTDHLDLIDRFVAEHPEAVAAAARRAGLDPDQAERLRRSLARELARRGLDPEVELRDDAALARQLCRQVAICSDYIALTVRELDGYLRQSALPVQPAAVDVLACIDDALTILGPRLEAAGVAIERPSGAGDREGVAEIRDAHPAPTAAPPGETSPGQGVAEIRGDPTEQSNYPIPEALREKPGIARPCVRADRRLLVHALVNLLKNAVEAATTTDRPPRIGLAVRPEGPMVTIAVADNGPGIPPAALSRLFEVGYSTKGAGRGRGLTIVRESIQAQGGRIEVESRPGAGTEFRILLPRAEDPGPA